MPEEIVSDQAHDSPSGDDGSSGTVIVVAVIVATLLVIFLIVLFIRQRRKREHYVANHLARDSVASIYEEVQLPLCPV